jgi:hypothetical protein
VIKLAQIEYVDITDLYIIASICLKVDQEEEEDTWTQQPHMSQFHPPYWGGLNFANLVLFHQSRHQQNVRVFTEKLHY